MGHNQTKVLMGSTQSSVKESTTYPGTTLEAGLVAHLKSDGTVTKAKADGSPVGVSLGKPLDATGVKTAVCRKGLRVPLKLKAAFTPDIGAVVSIDDAEGYGTGDGSKTAVNAVYAEPFPGAANALVSATGGVAEEATDDTGTVRVALIDFVGGL